MSNSQKETAREGAAGTTLAHFNITKHVQVLEIERLKDSNKLLLAAGHNLRKDGRDPVHIDSTRSHLNVILCGEDTVAGIVQYSAELMAEVLKPPRKDFVRWLEVVVSLPHGSGIDEAAFFKEVVVWTGGFFEVPILSAIVHYDEAAPHIHLLLLPLFQGRMIGSSLFKPNRYLVRHNDFHAKVGRKYGLRLPAPKKYHSAAVRAVAADSVVVKMKAVIKNLEPAFWDAIRATLKADPEPLMNFYGIEYPATKQPKKQTFASIIAKPCKPEKPKALRNTQAKSARIEKTKALPVQSVPENNKALPVYGFAIPAPLSALEHDDPDDEYTRERDAELSAGYWDEQRGEWITAPSPRTRTPAPAIEQTRAQIVSLQERRSA